MERKQINSPSYFIGQSGGDLISFGSGQPDLPPPRQVYDVLPNYHDFKYGLIQGSENLREALALQYPEGKSSSFVITNGASEALDLSLRVLKETCKGKLFLPKPYYYSYPFNAQFSQFDVKYYELDDGKINLDRFIEQLDDVSVILINSPSNPTGSVQDIPVLKAIEKLAQERGIYIISDEVYKDLIYDRENYLIQGPHVITINSFSKTYAMCGIRVGYMYSRDPNLVQRVIEYKTHTSMNTNILGQEMALAATKVPKQYIDKQVSIWQERRDIIYQGLLDIGLEVWKPEGAFYVFPYIKNSNQVINDLYYDYNIIAYDGAWFGAPDRVRFSYALDKKKINEGLNRLESYLKKRKAG